MITATVYRLRANTKMTNQTNKDAGSVALDHSVEVGDCIRLPYGMGKGAWKLFQVESIEGTQLQGIYRQEYKAIQEGRRIVDCKKVKA